MKRIIALFFAVVFLTAVFSGCENDGTSDAISVKSYGTTAAQTEADSTETIEAVTESESQETEPQTEPVTEALTAKQTTPPATQKPRTEAPARTAAPTAKVEVTTFANDNVNKTVFWVDNGEVYHVSKGCSTLSRSKNIHSGTIAQSGKARCCKRCG